MAILLCEQYYDFAQELADDYLVMQRGDLSGLTELPECSWCS